MGVWSSIKKGVGKAGSFIKNNAGRINEFAKKHKVVSRALNGIGRKDWAVGAAALGYRRGGRAYYSRAPRSRRTGGRSRRTGGSTRRSI